jgi:hypothetical protein
MTGKQVRKCEKSVKILTRSFPFVDLKTVQMEVRHNVSRACIRRGFVILYFRRSSAHIIHKTITKQASYPVKILLGTRRSSHLEIQTVKNIEALLLHAKQAQRGGRDIGLPKLDAGARRGQDGQRYVPAAVPTGKTPRLGGLRGRSG